MAQPDGAVAKLPRTIVPPGVDVPVRAERETRPASLRHRSRRYATWQRHLDRVRNTTNTLDGSVANLPGIVFPPGVDVPVRTQYEICTAALGHCGRRYAAGERHLSGCMDLQIGILAPGIDSAV